MSDKITLKNVGGRTFQVGTDANREPIPFLPKKTASFERSEAKRLMSLYPEEFEVVSGDIDAAEEKTPAKAAEAAPAPTPAAEKPLEEMKANELKAILDEAGVKYNPVASKAVLTGLIEEYRKAKAAEAEVYVEGEIYTVDGVQYIGAKPVDSDEVALLPVTELSDEERAELVKAGKLAA